MHRVLVMQDNATGRESRGGIVIVRGYFTERPPNVLADRDDRRGASALIRESPWRTAPRPPRAAERDAPAAALGVIIAGYEVLVRGPGGGVERSKLWVG